MPSYRSVVSLLVLLSVSTAALADDLIHLLEKMSEAAHGNNYQGILILRKADQLSTLAVKHAMDHRGVWESLETLSGDPRKVIRQNNRVLSIFPERKKMTVRQSNNASSLHHKLPDNIRGLKRFYRFIRLEDDRMAGYDSLVLDLRPRDQYRYGYRYWLDRDSGMLLRCDVMDTENRVIEQMMFTRLEYLPSPPEEAFQDIHLDGYTVQSLNDIIPDPSELTWQVTALPAGFSLSELHYRGSAEASFTQLVYSDGLASVSVFIEKQDPENPREEGASSVNAVHAYGVPLGDYFVTAVGEVPARTVMRLAKSTRRKAILPGGRLPHD